MKRKLAFFVLATWWIASSSAWPWGKEGHQIVGRIAEVHLTPQALAGVNELINLDNKDNPPLRLSDDAIVNWADKARHSWTNSAPWHYVDIPYDATAYDPVRDCTNHNGCVIDSIHVDFQALADRKNTPKQRFTSLKLLVHFVGDIHQPLHCIFRPYGEYADDRGGNLCPIAFLTPAATNNLHVVWDSLLLQKSLTDQQVTNVLQYANALNTRINDDDKRAWSTGTPEEWAWQSHQLAILATYAGIPTNGPATTLDAAYVKRNQAVVDRQLMRAGIRLAQLLNDAFK